MSQFITLPENVEEVLEANEEPGARILLSVVEEMKQEATDSEGKPAWNRWSDGPLWTKSGWNNWPQWRQK